MSLVPAKRPGRGGGRDSDYEDCEDDGLCVGYAEEVDERRADLLRRLEFKTSGPASLVNPWASRPHAHTPASVGGGKLVASFALSQEEADPWDADPHAATRAEDAQAYRAVRLVLQGHGQGAEARPAGGAAAAAAAAVVAAVAQVAQLVEERPLHHDEEGEGGPAAAYDPASLQSQGQSMEQEQGQQVEGRPPLSPLAAWQGPCQGGAAQHGQQQAQRSPGVHPHLQPGSADGKHPAGGAGRPRAGLPLAVTLSGPGFGFDAGGAGRRDGQHGGAGRHGPAGQGGAKKAKFAIRDPIAPGTSGACAVAGGGGEADPAAHEATQGTQAGGAGEGGRGRGPSSLAALLGGGGPTGPQASSRTPGPSTTPAAVPLLFGSAPRHQPHAAAAGNAATGGGAAGSPRHRHDPAWQTPHVARTRGKTDASGRSRGHAASTPAHTPLPAAVSFTPLVSIAAPTPSSSGRRPPVTPSASCGAGPGGGGGASLRELLRSDRTPPPPHAVTRAGAAPPAAGGGSGAGCSGRAGPTAPGAAAARSSRGAGRGATAAVPWSRTLGPAPGAGGGGGGGTDARDAPGPWLGHGQGQGQETREGTGHGHGTGAQGFGQQQPAGQQHTGPAGFPHQHPYQPGDHNTPGRMGEGGPHGGAAAGGVGGGGRVAVGDMDYGQPHNHQNQDVQREEGQQHVKPSARELMQQQSHRQQAFLAGLGAPGHAAGPGAAVAGAGGGGGGVASTPQSLATLLAGSGGGGSLAVAGRRGGAGKAAAGLVGRLQAVLAGLKAAADREVAAASSAAPPPPPPGSLLVEVRAKAREAHLVSTTCIVRQVYGSDLCNGQPSGSQRQQSQQQQQQPAASQLPSQRARGLAAGGAFAASTPPPRVCAGQVVHLVLDSKKAARGPGCAGEMDPGSSFLVLPPYKVLPVGGERGSQGAGEAGGGAGGGAGGSGGGGGTGAESGGGGTVVVMAHVVRAGT